jgi:hypothetical protein
MDYDAIDPTFKSDLIASDTFVDIVAKWYRNTHGYKVITFPLPVHPGNGPDPDYTDACDMEIVLPIDVKRLTRPFTSVDTYPFPGEPIFVETVQSYDRKPIKPALHVLLNPDVTGCLIIKSATRPHWTVMEKPSRGRMRSFYACPRNLVEFKNIRTFNTYEPKNKDSINGTKK